MSKLFKLLISIVLILSPSTFAGIADDLDREIMQKISSKTFFTDNEFKSVRIRMSAVITSSSQTNSELGEAHRLLLKLTYLFFTNKSTGKIKQLEQFWKSFLKISTEEINRKHIESTLAELDISKDYYKRNDFYIYLLKFALSDNPEMLYVLVENEVCSFYEYLRQISKVEECWKSNFKNANAINFERHLFRLADQKMRFYTLVGDSAKFAKAANEAKSLKNTTELFNNIILYRELTIAIRNHQFDKAKEALAILVKNKSEKGDIVRMTTLYNLEKNNIAEAKEEYEKFSIDLSDRNLAYHYRIGSEIYFANKDYTKAIEYLNLHEKIAGDNLLNYISSLVARNLILAITSSPIEKLKLEQGIKEFNALKARYNINDPEFRAIFNVAQSLVAATNNKVDSKLVSSSIAEFEKLSGGKRLIQKILNDISVAKEL